MASLVLPGTRIGSPDEPIAQNAHLGWMILGKFQDSIHTYHIRCHQTALDTEYSLTIHSITNQRPFDILFNKICNEHTL